MEGHVPADVEPKTSKLPFALTAAVAITLIATIVTGVQPDLLDDATSGVGMAATVAPPRTGCIDHAAGTDDRAALV